jgi:hypothetical protein
MSDLEKTDYDLMAEELLDLYKKKYNEIGEYNKNNNKASDKDMLEFVNGNLFVLSKIVTNVIFVLSSPFSNEEKNIRKDVRSSLTKELMMMIDELNNNIDEMNDKK